MIPINDNQARDVDSKAVLFTNKKALNAHRQKIRQNIEINILRTEVEELKTLVEKLINKG